MFFFNVLMNGNFGKKFKMKTIILLVILLKFKSGLCKWHVWDKELDWWQKTIVYQIYPRSFYDSDGDGIGDLKGVQAKLSYFNETGINTVWLSPIFKSPMADLGYDISNFTDIDPTFGTIEDFIDLVKAIKENGMHVMLDFVPNHSSDEHEWFLKSVDRIDPYTDFYMWRDGRKLDNGTITYPNNWLSLFGGSGWTFNEKRGQYYYHQFSVKQPDFNFSNVNVREEMKRIMGFWLDLGVDGFRMDAVKHLMEDPQLHDEACLPEYEGKCNSYNEMVHNYTTDWPTSYDLIYEWRQYLDEYKDNSSDKRTRIMLTEAYTRIDYLMEYYGNETHPGAHAPFNFFLVSPTMHSNSSTYLGLLNAWLDNMPEGEWPNWVAGNHDNHRVATRVGNELVDAYFMMTMLFPGTAVTYQGDELGQPDTAIRPDQVRDPNNNGGGAVDVRDSERGPFLWDSSENAGFTTARIPWEPILPAYWELNLESQKKAERSHYKVYRQLSELRETATIQRGDIFAKNISTWVFAFARRLPGNESYLSVINFGSELEVIYVAEYIPHMPPTLDIAVASINSGYEIGETITSTVTLHTKSKPLALRPKASVVLTTRSIPENPTTNSPQSSTKSPNETNPSNGTPCSNFDKTLFILTITSVLMYVCSR